MIKRIVYKEFVEAWRDGRFRVAAVIIIGLLTTALAAGMVGASRQTRERLEAVTADRVEWLAQGARNPHSAAHFGRYAFKPVTGFAFFDAGLDRYTGVAVWLEAHFQDTFRHRPIEDATALQRFAEMTAASLLQQLAPLFIVLFAFGQFAAEREHGLLRQLLSTGIPPQQLFLGKLGGSALFLAGVFVPAAVLGALTLVASQGHEAALRSPDRVAWLAAAYIAYLGTILVIALGVSASMRSARAALLMLLALWAFGCLLVPRLAADIAARVAPSPSYEAFWHAIEHDIKEGFQGSGNEAVRDRTLRARVLAEYGVPTIEQLPVSFEGLSLQAMEDFSNRVYDFHYRRLWDSFNRQERVQEMVGLLSPVMGVRAVSMGMAGTDLAHFRHFSDAAEAYRRTMVRRLNVEFRDKAGPESYAYVDDGSLWSTVPDFSYSPPDTRWILAQQRRPLASILVWLVVACGVALWSPGRLRAA